MNLDFIPFINLFGVLVIGGAMIYIQWKTGVNNGVKVASEVINTYKTQVEQLREEVKTEKAGREEDRHSLRNEIQALMLKVATMEGANTEKDKKIKEFTEIFQGKNPDQTQYMADMRDFTLGVARYMKESSEIFAGMKSFLSSLNDKSNVNQARNEKIDKEV